MTTNTPERRATDLELARMSAISAAEAYADACHENEAKFSGWGDGVVPPEATEMRKEAEQALTLLKARAQI